MFSGRRRIGLNVKMLAVILPPVLLCLVGLGVFSAVNSSNATRRTVETYLVGVVETFVSQNMQVKQDLLRDNGLDSVPSFVKSYKERAVEALNDVRLHWPGRMFVVDFQGDIAGERGSADRESRPAGNVWRAVQRQLADSPARTLSGFVDEGGQGVFYVARRFAPWHWDLFVVVERSVVDAGSYRIRVATVVLTIVCCVLVVLVVMAALRHAVVEPLRALGAAASLAGRFEGGAALAAVGSDDEIGDLARDLNRLTEAIGGKQADLRRLNAALEAKVNERTRELARANVALRDQVVLRERAEIEADESRRVYQRLFEGLNDAVVLFDGSGRLVRGNRRFHAMTGLDERTLEEKRVFDVIEPDGADAARAVVARLSGGDQQRFETVIRGADGTPMPVEVSVGRIELVGRSLIQAVMRDITERRRAEEKSRKAARMDSLGHLTGGIAHDFNNLLAAIVNLSEVIADAPELSEATRDRVAAIRRAADRGAALTERLSAFSREAPLLREEVRVAEVLADMEATLRETVGEAVPVVIRVAPGLPPILVDRRQMEHAIVNLAANGRDAMPGGGPLTIDARMGDADAPTDLREYVRIAVIDVGVGMANDIADQAFDPFFTTKPFGRGTGWGLSMVYGFAKQSGGEVEVRSAPGRGTEIAIYLPAAPVGSVGGGVA